MSPAEFIDIVYHDARLIVVNKPAGVMVHRSRLAGRGERFVLQVLRNQIGRHVYPVHRLDRPTSGALLFGLDPETARMTSALFARRKVRKTYLAVTRGFVEPRGSVDIPLCGDVYRRGGEAAMKNARTVYERLARIEVPHPVGPYATARYTLLQVEPETGRMHQIRRHLRDIAHPVVGDRRYGDSRHNRFFKEVIGCPRLLLAAVELAFEHPVTGEHLCIAAPIGPRFFAVLRRFDWVSHLPKRWRPAGSRTDSDGRHPPARFI
jgi:tRNA pseudouridine65 synthase